jgi:hypothetical protein
LPGGTVGRTKEDGGGVTDQPSRPLAADRRAPPGLSSPQTLVAIQYSGLADCAEAKASTSHDTLAIGRKCCSSPVVEQCAGNWTPVIATVSGFHDTGRVPPIPLTDNQPVFQVEETDVLRIPDGRRNGVPL